MENYSDWIEHLKHPLVLIGFGLFILALLLKPFFLNNNNKLSGRATERLMNKAINFVFILALLVIVAGFVLSLKPDFYPKKISQTTKSKEQRKSVTQETTGKQSPAINTKGDVNINYGGVLSSEKKVDKINSKNQEINEPATVNQKTKGDQSPAINSSEDANVNYEN